MRREASRSLRAKAERATTSFNIKIIISKDIKNWVVEKNSKRYVFCLNIYLFIYYCMYNKRIMGGGQPNKKKKDTLSKKCKSGKKK